MAKDYSELNKEELIRIIEKLESRKKYGLVWDEEKTREQFEKDSENALPVLKEIKSKEIKTDPYKPYNIFIEGDNYHALSVLNYTHQGKVDVIYIDPPYNTGKSKEWKFNDRWVDKNDSYRHSKWLSFMSKRLILAKNLLSDRGVIFISIDDNEYSNLKLLCDEIFGEQKHVGTLIWEKKKKGSHLDSYITNIKEYVLVYHKSNSFLGLVGIKTDKKETYPCLNPGNGYSFRVIPKGTKSNYKERDFILRKGNVISAGNMKLTLDSDLVIKNGVIDKDVKINAEWRYNQDKINDFAKRGTLYLTRDLYIRHVVTEMRMKKLKDLLPRVEHSYLADLKDRLLEEYESVTPDSSTIEGLKNEIAAAKSRHKDEPLDNLFKSGWGSNEDADDEQREFFGRKVFDYPKPTKLIKKIIASARIDDALVLDFFAGTGTTAQAVLELNEQGYCCNFILSTNNEDNNSDGTKIATDICYPRVKKVIKGYKNRSEKKVIGTGGNLKYYKTSFVKNSISSDDMKFRITRECTEMLCLREGIFNEKIKKSKYRVFEQNDCIMAVYYALERDALSKLKKDLDKMKGSKILYCFTLDPLGLNDDDFADWEGVELEPIPQKILDIYEQIYEY